MIEKIEIHNFRGFRSVDLAGLRRFNFIVGPNGSGKTALLEALFLSMAPGPKTALDLRLLRGQLGMTLLPGSHDETLLRHLFHRCEMDTEVFIQFLDSVRGARSLRIHSASSGRSVVTLPSLTDFRVNEPSGRVVEFEWRTETGQHQARLEALPDGRLGFSTWADAYPGVLVPSSSQGSDSESILRFSEISKRRQDGRIVSVLRRAFPQVEQVSLETEAGETAFFVGVKDLPVKIPIGVLSAGIRRYWSILLAAVNSPGAALLLDEVENGFYFDRFEPMMNSIFDECRRSDVQIFATTHSREFLASLQPMIRDAPDDFALIRMDGRAGGPAAYAFGGVDFGHALAEEVEVR
ncbi:MAG: hypothetical protein FJW40_13205 [Acidobacteria bacterium]|nr:hypothetical protein [Acidobacteriota bacterium]